MPSERAEISLYPATFFPALAFSRGARGRVLFAPVFRYSDSTGSKEDTILASEAPTGFGRYGQLGPQIDGRYDSRYDKDLFASGFEFRTKAAFHPKVWDVEQDCGFVDAELGVHLPISRRVFLSLFAGGKKLWGDDFPFFDAAYIGGHHTTLGYNWNRFAGDASLYGIADLKLVLLQVRKLLPGELGLLLESDAGRVWVDGESSSKWHPSYGVGVFYAPFNRGAISSRLDLARAWRRRSFFSAPR